MDIYMLVKSKTIESWTFCNTFHETLPNYKENKSKNVLPLETKNTQNHENRRLGLIESFNMQHCNLRGYIRPSPPPTPPPQRRLKLYLIFKITRMGSMTPKEVKYNLHYGDVRGDFLRPPHDTTPATVE